MGRLSAQMIRKCPHFLNTFKERVLDLRGKKIAFIENLEATKDQFDTIDLSDNDIVNLENFPVMNRLGKLFINNNRITSISPNLGEFLPQMHTLGLARNRLTDLADIDPLASLPKLQFLSLLYNTVTEHPEYRLYVISKLKQLQSLDFEKVQQQEKIKSAKRFDFKDAKDQSNHLAPEAYMVQKVYAQDTAKEQCSKGVSVPVQITTIKAPIVNTETVDEVASLEKLDANTDEALEKTDKSKRDGQDQGNESDDGIQNEESTPIKEEMLGADFNSTSSTVEEQIESYIYRNFQETSYNILSSWRKRSFHGIHIIPPAWMQAKGDCSYNATVAIMVIKYKVLYACRPPGNPNKPRHFNVRLSAHHLKSMVVDFMSSPEGSNFKPGDRLAVCLLMAQRYGVVSEEDFAAGCPPEAVRYKVATFEKLSASTKQAIPIMLDNADMVLSSFIVTERYRNMLPHDIYRYVEAERKVGPAGTKPPPNDVHCVVLTSPGRAYTALEEDDGEAKLTLTSEQYYEYLNSYSQGYGVDGCGFVYAESIARTYAVSVVDM